MKKENESAAKKDDEENKERILAERICFIRDIKGFEQWFIDINKLSAANIKKFSAFTPTDITPAQQSKVNELLDEIAKSEISPEEEKK